MTQETIEPPEIRSKKTVLTMDMILTLLKWHDQGHTLCIDPDGTVTATKGNVKTTVRL